MADNEINQNCVNNVDNIQPESFLEKERSRKGREVIAVLNKSEKTWKIFSKKQHILHRLYKEQICTSNNFNAINYLKAYFYRTIESSTEASRRVKDIDKEAKHLLILLEDFEKKLDRSGKIVRDFIRDMKVHMSKLRKELDTVKNAKSVEDMAEMDIPNLDWIGAIPNPKIEELADHWDWDGMQLKLRTTKLLNEFVSVIHGQWPNDKFWQLERNISFWNFMQNVLQKCEKERQEAV